MAVGAQRLQAQEQQAVAGLALDHLLRIGLFAQRLAQQSQEQAEGMRAELAQFRQSRWMSRRQPLPRRLQLARLLGQLRRHQRPFATAVAHAGQRTARCSLAEFAQARIDRQRRRIQP